MTMPIHAEAPSYRLSHNSSVFLNLVRAAAAQAVVFGHGISFLGLARGFQPPNFPYVQNLAVVVFFVLSGFVITHATMRKPKTFQFREFVVDRFARIYPGYLGALLFVFLIDSLAIALKPETFPHGPQRTVGIFIGNVFMLQNFSFGPPPFGSARPFWSLAIEWWIYLLFGWLALSRRRPAWIFVAVLVPLTVIPAYNAYWGYGHGLALVWMFGAVAYLILRQHLVTTRTVVIASVSAISAALVAGVLYTSKEPYQLVVGLLLAIALCTTVAWLDRVPWHIPAWLTRIISFVANYSFTLYLLHYSIFNFLVTTQAFENKRLTWVVGVVASNIASIAVAYFTEFRHHAFGAWMKRQLRLDRATPPPTKE